MEVGRPQREKFLVSLIINSEVLIVRCLCIKHRARVGGLGVLLITQLRSGELMGFLMIKLISPSSLPVLRISTGF